jgi:hypothetical protein
MLLEYCGLADDLGPGPTHQGTIEQYTQRALLEKELEKLSNSEKLIACLE